MVQCQVLVKSDDNAAELEKTFAILDSYGERTGEKVWRILSSLKALGKIAKAVRNSFPSRGCCIFKIVKKNGLETFAVIGDENLFHENMAVFKKSSDMSVFSNEEGILKTLEDVAFYSGYAHDIGKNNDKFQEKLSKGAKIRDPMRYEIVSSFYLEIIKKYGVSFQDKIEKEQPSDFMPKKLKVSSLYDVIKHCVTQHHKGIVYEPRWSPLSGETEAVIDDEKFKRSFTDGEMPSKISVYGTFDPQIVSDILDMFEKEYFFEDMSRSDILDIIFILAKTALIIADHNVSRNLVEEGIAKKKKLPGICMANSIQTLRLHLMSVAHESKKNAGAIVKDFLEEPRFLDPSDVKKIEYFPEKMPEMFSYQKASVKKLEKARKEEGIDGAFVVLYADTGYGKTRAGAKIMTAMSGRERVRFDVLFGLRSLTIQTYESYLNDINLPPEDTALVIGGFNDEKDESSDIDVDDETVYVKGEEYTYLYTELLKNDKYKTLIASPICVSTIDYAMKGVDFRKSKYTVPFLRNISSDSILDEIDGYSAQDMQAICRLMYLKGMFGKKVVISSATVSPTIVRELYKAYAKGYRIYKSLNLEAKPLLFSAVSNDVPIVVERDMSHGDVESVMRERMNRKIELKISSDSKRIIGKPLSEPYNPELLLQAVKIMHELNKEKTEYGTFISAGMVKFFLSKSAFEEYLAFCGFLKENPEMWNGYRFKTLFLHSRMLFHVKNSIDRFLKRTLSRSGANPLGGLGDLAEENEDVIFLLFTTPIIEAGRDLDFDFALSEFVSSRSLVQTAGRVNRHRRFPKKNDQVNFCTFFRERFSSRISPFSIETSLDGVKRIGEVLGKYALYDLNDKVVKKEEGFISEKLSQSNELLHKRWIFSMFHPEMFKFRNSEGTTIFYEIKNGEYLFFEGKDKRPLDIEEADLREIEDFDIFIKNPELFDFSEQEKNQHPPFSAKINENTELVFNPYSGLIINTSS